MRLIKTTLLFIALVSIQIVTAQWIDVPPPVEARTLMVVQGGMPVASGVTYYDDLKCDDNAASTDVVNAGTRTTAWAAHTGIDDFTSLLHSATAKEGTGSFSLNDGNDNFNITNFGLEKFELKFWFQITNSTPSTHELWFQIGNGDLNQDVNEICLYRLTTNDQWRVFAKGNNASATLKTRITNNFTFSTGTWYQLKLNVDATGTTWTVDIAWSSNGTSWTNGVWTGDADWATGYAANWDAVTAWFGDGTGSYAPVALIDYVTVESK